MIYGFVVAIALVVIAFAAFFGVVLLWAYNRRIQAVVLFAAILAISLGAIPVAVWLERPHASSTINTRVALVSILDQCPDTHGHIRERSQSDLTSTQIRDLVERCVNEALK